MNHPTNQPGPPTHTHSKPIQLWEDELPLLDSLLQEDRRNNSAWHHRWFVIHGHELSPTHAGKNEEEAAGVREREMEYALGKIKEGGLGGWVGG